MKSANPINRGHQNRAESRWRALLCLPLLRGRAAEKWAMPLVAYPALALATGLSAAAFVLAPWATAIVMSGLVAWQMRQRSILINPQFTLTKLPSRPVHEFRPLAARSPLAVDRASALAEATCMTQLVVGQNSGALQIDLEDAPIMHVGGLKHLSPRHKALAMNIPLIATAMPPSNLPAAAANVALHEIGHAKQSYLATTLSGLVDQFNGAALLVCGVQTAVSGYAHAGLMLANHPLPDAFAAPTTALAALGAAAMSFLLARIFYRQCEYDADRFAVRTGEMPHTLSHALVACSAGEKMNASPSVIANLLNPHPCPNLRIREIFHYGEELGIETAKQTSETPRFIV